MQHGAHFVGRQVNVGLAVIALNKTMAVAVAGNRALEFREQSGRCAGVVVRCFDKKSLFVIFVLGASGNKLPAILATQSRGWKEKLAWSASMSDPDTSREL
ncbi:hypothetical protein [Polaromonas sp.]|uniref:hypothetical protein n=1 Tax=Polaromonas sp. TaxID=1869339 RepID=UPI00286B91DD|nr:hypothetical protein [Polaromonas sp.]